MHATDIMIDHVIYINENDTLEDVVKVLHQHHISGVPVVDNERHVVGIVTKKDLMTPHKGSNFSSYIEIMASILFVDGNKLTRVGSRKYSKLTAADVMSTPVYVVHLEATIEEIVSIMMNRRINRIPVIDDDNTLVGIIGRNDLLPILIK